LPNRSRCELARETYQSILHVTKTQSTWTLALALAASSTPALGQAVKGTLEGNRLEARTSTFYVNTTATINNNKTESLGVAIANNGNVIIGWEDDGADLTDLESVWTLYSPGGGPLTPDTEQKSLQGGSVTSKFLSYFRKDKSAIPGRTSWGPKIKANLFGDGHGMGATSFELGLEVPELANINLDEGGGGDFPSIQLLDNAGNPIGIVSYSDADAEAQGDIRIADWDYLSNGNVVIVGESRQNADLNGKFGGADPGKHVTYKVVDVTGKEIKALSLASSDKVANELWHGAAVTKDGFAIRINQGGRTKVRLFDNTGNPKGDNIDLGTLAGNDIAAGGGRGDSRGFHGNGVDLYAYISTGQVDGKSRVFLTVLGADGKLRYSKSVSDDVTFASNPGGADVALDASGRALVVYNAKVAGSDFNLILGRMIDPTGKPMGDTFFVSEREDAATSVGDSTDPRVATRNDAFAVIWESKSSEADAGTAVVAGRFFGLAHKPGSIESVGLKRIVPDTPIINPGRNALGNWEPNASQLGGEYFLIEGNTFAEGTEDKQRYVVMIQPAAGGPGKLVEGFYTDAGQPFKGPINASRQNGNPGRVAGDARPGAVNYMVGAEASPHTLPEFDTASRWNLGFDRLADGRYGTVQIYALNTATLTPTPLTKALDSAHGRRTEGDPQGNNQISRFGGDMTCLDNGNFVSVVEDRSKVLRPEGNAAVATIFAPNGTVVKEAFKVADGDLWSNVAAFQGGFAVRVAGVLHFYNNAGELQGSVDQDTSSGEQFDRGRGDGTRISGHINAPYLFLAGKIRSGNVVKVVAWDARTRAFAASAEVSEAGFAGNFDRVNLASDALSRVAVGWVSQPTGYAKQQVATRVLAFDGAAKSFRSLSKSFLPFINAHESDTITSVQMTLAMTTQQIMVAAKGTINLENKPDSGGNSPNEINFYTVISHPDPKPNPMVTGGDLKFSKISRSQQNVIIEWDGTATLQAADAVTGNWADVANAKSPFSANAATGSKFYRLKR